MPFWIYRNRITPYNEDREGGFGITLMKAGIPVLVDTVDTEEEARRITDAGNKREAKYHMAYWYQDHPTTDDLRIKQAEEPRYYGPKNSEKRRT